VRSFVALFGGVKPVIGMIHLKPLPGSPLGGSLEDALDAARADAEILTAAGVDGLVVENFGDAPFAKDEVEPVTVAAMSVVCRELRRDHNVPLGVNVLRNDARAALSIASVTGADFIRVNVHVGAVVGDQGVIEGQARRTLLLRRALGAQVLLFSDVRVKHARPLGAAADFDVVAEARETAGRGMADALILSGPATGSPPDPAELERVKRALPETPLLVGSGCDASNLGAFWPFCDGMIVGSSMKKGGDPRAPIDEGSARAVLGAASELRRSPKVELREG
jgi:membrane complex biogenesis BtpA family protein